MTDQDAPLRDVRVAAIEGSEPTTETDSFEGVPLAGEKPPGVRRARLGLAFGALGALGLLVRLVHVEAGRDRLVGGDGFTYLSSALDASVGHWFGRPGQPYAHHPPLWDVVLGLAASAGLDDLTALRRLSVVIGMAGVAALAAAANTIAGRRVAVVAAGIAALYPGFWIWDLALLSEVLVIPLVAICILCMYRWHDRPTRANAIATAVACTLAGLTRAEMMGMLAVFVVVVLIRRGAEPVRSRLVTAAACGAVCVALVGPWAAYNTARFDAPVLISTGLGGTMSAGANDATFQGHDLGYYDTTWKSAGSRVRGMPPNRAIQDARLRKIALRYQWDHRDRLPVVLAAREGRTFGLYRIVEEADRTAEWTRGFRGVARAWVAAYVLLVPFAFVGARRLRRSGRPLYPLLAPVGLVALASLITFGQIRYRVPADVALALLAAVGIARPKVRVAPT